MQRFVRFFSFLSFFLRVSFFTLSLSSPSLSKTMRNLVASFCTRGEPVVRRYRRDFTYSSDAVRFGSFVFLNSKLTRDANLTTRDSKLSRSY